MSDRLISDERLDAALAAADPLVPGSLDAAGIAQAVDALRTATFPSNKAARRPQRHHRLRRAGRPWGPLAAGAFVVVAAVVVSLVGLGGSGVHGAGSSWLVTVTPAQAAQLDRVAVATARGAGPRGGQWLYQSYEVIADEGLPWQSAWIGFRVRSETQHWTGGRVQRWRVETTRFGFDSSRDRATYQRYRRHFLPEIAAEGGPTAGRISDVAQFRPSTPTSPVYTPQEFPDTKLGILHRFKQLVTADEARLAPSRFRAQFKQQLASGLFGVLVMLLEQSTSERQRAAALQALAYVRDVRMLGERRDIRGRVGLAVRLNDWQHESVETLIIDRSNGNLLQDTQKQWSVSDHVSVIRTVYLDRAVVKSMTVAPGGRAIPYNGPAPKVPTGASSR